nr:class I SAM-dependent methyltransferase [Allobranchiibius sp. CTAmp26]
MTSGIAPGDAMDRSGEGTARGTVMRSNTLSSSAQTGQNGGPADSEVADHNRANRGWWDDEAEAYYAEHGAFLGDTDLVWGPEGWSESDLRIFGDPAALADADLLEIGAGAAQGARWANRYAARVVASDLSAGMLARAATLNEEHGVPLPLVLCDGTALPFADASFDLVFTAYGVVPFVADSQAVMHEAARVVRPGGRFVFSTTHPVRWAFPDVPGPEGLRADRSYFDRTPYVEMSEDGTATYAEHHRTLGDRVRELHAAGLVLEDLIEPEWPEDNRQVWGGWSPTRGAILPGTAIFVARLPRA